MKRPGQKIESIQQALRMIRPGERIFLGSGAGVPRHLVSGLAEFSEHFSDNEILSIATLGDAPYLDPAFESSFRYNALFIAGNTRDAVNDGRADYSPARLSEIPRMLEWGRLPVGTCLVQVAEGKDGSYSLGVAVDVVLSAMKSARLVIAQVNPEMPYTFGESELPREAFDVLVPGKHEIPELPVAAKGEVEKCIGEHVASLVTDGATLQLGIGSLPDAIAHSLIDKNDLGFHSEMFSDGARFLFENGNLTGLYKSRDKGIAITSFALGSRELYRFVHRNPRLRFMPSNYTNNTLFISKQRRMTAINSALEVDLTGQVASDSVGGHFYSGVGGQVDFIRGAAHAPEGFPIIALPSTAKGGALSRIVCRLTPGSGVVTSRSDIHYIVTEYGIADLWGKTIEERVLGLVEVAHPDFRQQLLDEAKDAGLVRKDEPLYDLDCVQNPDLYTLMKMRDGRQVYLRPIRPSDERSLKEFFYSHSEEDVYERYGFVKKTIHHSEAVERKSIRRGSNMVMVAIAGGSGGSRFLGVARYSRQENNESCADAAIILAGDCRRLGLGKAMLFQLGRDAASHGFESLSYHIQENNQAMLGLFVKVYPHGKLDSARDGFVDGLAMLKGSA